jgi:hypothetical protein
MKFHGGSIIALVIAASFAVPAAAAPLAISSCKDEVPARQTGVLTGDVQCKRYCTDFPTVECTPGCPLDPEDSCTGESIRLGRGAKLRLDGHDLYGSYNHDAIVCSDEKPGGTCTVVGPGSVQSTKGSAVASAAMNIRVRDLLMVGSYGTLSTKARVDVRHSVFGSWDYDVYGARQINLVDTTSGPGGGLYATDKVSLRNVRSASPVYSDGRIVGRNVTLLGDASGCPIVEAPRVHITNLVGDGCSP